MQGFLKEFKAFALRGNAVDLAVAVIIGAAFGKIVSSAVDNLFMPVISIFLGIVNLSVPQFNIIKQHLCVKSNVQVYATEETRRPATQEAHSFINF